ncbi:MAG: phospholipase D-like domain-containing protein [Butyricicoccus sp.]
MRTPATKELIEQHPRHAARARYIETLDGMPVWTNTETKYFRIGEEMFDSMCKELRRAQKFIFLEYFIIEEGIMWDTILDILREKAAAGLDVRVLYDDVGSICTLPKNYDRYLMSLGIHAVRFNRFIPTLNTYLNYRNHRKMTIIDGNVGYMGGINLADEYINKKVRFGYWKDTGIMLRVRNSQYDRPVPADVGVCHRRGHAAARKLSADRQAAGRRLCAAVCGFTARRHQYR